MSLGQRLRSRRESLNLTQAELADRARLTRVLVNRLEHDLTSNVRATHAMSLCKVLKCRLEWLVNGTGLPDAQESNSLMELTPSKVGNPLIDWNDIGEYLDRGVLRHGSVRRLSCPVDASGDTFALTVKDELMLPRFAVNDVIFVDPLKTPVDGDFVIMSDTQHRNAKLRGYMSQNNQVIYRALSHDIPPDFRFINKNHEMKELGVVVAHLKPL